jgi:hypothetical protein
MTAHRQQRTGRPLDRLRQRTLACQRLRGHNVATVALANRMARIIWATWKHHRPFDGNWAGSATNRHVLQLNQVAQIAVMISGSVRGAVKPITIVAPEPHPTVGSAPADLMMSRAVPSIPLTYRTNTRLQPNPLLTYPLTEESIPDC